MLAGRLQLKGEQETLKSEFVSKDPGVVTGWFRNLVKAP
jgi:hypothetical protein